MEELTKWGAQTAYPFTEETLLQNRQNILLSVNKPVWYARLSWFETAVFFLVLGYAVFGFSGFVFFWPGNFVPVDSSLFLSLSQPLFLVYGVVFLLAFFVFWNSLDEDSILTQF